MSKHFDRLLKMLKTRQEVTALGFSKDEIQSLASDMDKNLEIAEDAADDDVENTINTAIETVIPVLKLAQASSSRIVSKRIKELDDERAAEKEAAAQKAKEEEEKKAEEEARKKAEEEAKNNPNPKEPDESDKKYDELKEMFKAMTDKMTEKMTSQDETIRKQSEMITNLLRGNVKEKRKAVLEEKLKDAGTLGKTYRRTFEKMEFKDDSEFDAFLEQLDEDLTDYRQDIANMRLAGNNGVPDPNSPGGHDDEPKVMSDEEIDALAGD